LKLFVAWLRSSSRSVSTTLTARQLRRAASSIALNTAEGNGSTDGNARLRFRSAHASTQEVRACLDVAEALDYVDAVDAGLRDRFDRIAATLYRLAT
jgi:four helix bundle protein